MLGHPGTDLPHPAIDRHQRAWGDTTYHIPYIYARRTYGKPPLLGGWTYGPNYIRRRWIIYLDCSHFTYVMPLLYYPPSLHPQRNKMLGAHLAGELLC